MKYLLFGLIFSLPVLCVAQGSSGWGRGIDSDDYSIFNLIENSPYIIVSLLILFVLYCIVCSIGSYIINRKPSKEKIWTFNEFYYKYSNHQFFTNDGYTISIVRMSGNCFRKDIQFDCSSFYYYSINEMLSDHDLKVVCLLDGSYVLRKVPVV